MHGYFDLNHLSWAGSELVVNQMVSHKLRLDAQAAHLLRMASMGIVTKDCSLVYQSTSFHSYWKEATGYTMGCLCVVLMDSTQWHQLGWNLYYKGCIHCVLFKSDQTLKNKRERSSLFPIINEISKIKLIQ